MQIDLLDVYPSLNWRFEDAVDYWIDSLREDTSEWNFIDGEEGDYGKIYYWQDDILMITHVIHGGDNEEVIFSPSAKVKLFEIMQQVLEGFRP